MIDMKERSILLIIGGGIAAVCEDAIVNAGAIALANDLTDSLHTISSGLTQTNHKRYNG